uniref:Cysteine-serine-rich nuclear protein 2 n=1 Tax=Neogobius melanostomus TaxID=47308 RepID=A0A8C6TLN9_9GOBI
METAASLSLKRRYEEVDQSYPFSLTPKDSDDDISSCGSADSCDSLNPPSSSFTPTSILRRHKPSPGGKRVRFDVVTVYYFPRKQGFTSVPSQGGSSLGMARHHCSIRHYTLGEFAREQESSHRHTLRQHLRQEKLNARKMKLTRNGTVECAQAELLTLDDVSDEDLDVDALDVDDCFFLQPLPTKRRRALLRASGISRIDAREKAELRTIRLSREECGCDCRLYCDPRHCGCSQAGIKCQVDRMSFPCGCSRDGCGNMAGRIEFNPLRVRTHYLHTIMKLDSERRKIHLHGADDHFADSQPTFATLRPVSPDQCDLHSSEVVEEIVEVQDVLDERDILERENETAVLHLQSAEEQERREREGLEGAVEQELSRQAEVAAMEEVLLQGPFPTGATVLCITENQEETPYNKESLLYYQLSPIEAGAFENLPPAQEEEHDLGCIEIRHEEAKTAEEVICSQDVCTNRDTEERRCAEERPPTTKRSPPIEQCKEETCLEQEVY